MPTSLRYVDGDGNIFERLHESDIHEVIHWNPLLFPGGASTGFDYPISIGFSGSGIWGRDACIKRRRCDIFAIEIVTRGSTQFMQDGNAYLVEQGMVCILRPGCATEMRTGREGYVHKRFVQIMGTRLTSMREILKLTDCDCFRAQDPQRLCRLIKKASRLLQAKPSGFPSDLSSLAYEIMLSVAIDATKSHYPPPINAVLHYMARNVTRNPTVEDLCGAAGLSRPLLFRLFQQHLSDSPMHYFSRMKMAQVASELRLSHRRTSKEIALSYGYRDLPHFSNAFRKVMGISPGKYRKGEGGNAPAGSPRQ